jgi:hypothetical protein
MKTHLYPQPGQHAAVISGHWVTEDRPGHPERGHVYSWQQTALEIVVHWLRARMASLRSYDPRARQYPNDHEPLVHAFFAFTDFWKKFCQQEDACMREQPGQN